MNSEVKDSADVLPESAEKAEKFKQEANECFKST